MPQKVRVVVMLKDGVLDPQGDVIHEAIKSLGFLGAAKVRAGKVIELTLESWAEENRLHLEEIARDFLSNPIIEDFRIET